MRCPDAHKLFGVIIDEEITEFACHKCRYNRRQAGDTSIVHVLHYINRNGETVSTRYICSEEVTTTE